MNVVNWLSVFILSLLAIGALGYGTNRLTQRNSSLWKMGSLAFAGLICATMFATLSAYSSVVTSAVQAAAAQPLTCVGTPPLVRAGDEIAITGVAPANSEISLVYGEKTLATTTADAAGAFATTITLSVPGLQNVSCQVTADGQSNTIALSFLVIGQAAAPEPPPTNTPEPTATNTTEPTATETPAPAVAPPVVDTTTIPEQLLPGDTFRLRGTADGGARVRVTVNSRVVAGAVAGPQGNWRTTVGFARSGEYTLTAQLVQDDAVVAESEPIFLTVLEPTPTPEPTATDTPEPTATNTPEPTATNTTEPTATDTPEPTATNTPTAAPPVVDTTTIPDQLLPGDTFRLRGTADGGARVRVTVNSRVVAGAVAGPQGNWRTTVGFARSGEYTLTAQLVQDDVVVAESEPIFVTVLEPTPTPEPTATDTPEPTATNTTEPTATDTPEPTATDTPEPTATDTPEPTATNTPEPTATDTPEPTATPVPTPTATNTPEPTATNTPEPTATNTPEPTATNTPTPAAPVVDTESIPDQLLPGDTFRLRGTADGGARVRVAVNARVVAGAVAGPQGSWRTTVGFARSGEYTLTVQLVQDDAVVAESEPIFLTVLEPTPTPEPTATNTPEPTATNTPEPTATDTPEPTATNTPEPTATNTPEPTATNTPEPTATNTSEPTATDTPEPTATNTPEPTATNTPEPVAPVVDTASVPDQLLPGDTFRLRGTADGGARVRVAVNNRVVAGAVAGPQGNWRTTIGFAAAGEYTVTVQLVQEDAVVAVSEPIFLTVLAPTPTPEPTPTATSAPVDASQPVTDTGAAPVDASQAVTDTGAAPVDASQPVTDTGAAPVDASQPVTDTVDAPGALPGTGSDFSGGVPWVVLILLLGALVTLGMGRLAIKPTA